jgi:hypothetical protein
MNQERINQKIVELKTKKGFQQAYNRVKEKMEISTADLEYFNISFESFLRYAQLPDSECKKIISKLLIMFA